MSESGNGAPASFERLVAGVDGSDGAQRALRWCADLAAKTNAHVHAVHVASSTWLLELAALQFDTRPMIDELREKMTGEWTEVLRDRHLVYTTDVLQGDPATMLLQTAESQHADLVVVGASRHSGLRDELLGGTAHRLVNLAAVPVVVVPTPASEREQRWVPIPG
jgi:nucleotide-binding universal stress UspA family protein